MEFKSSEACSKALACQLAARIDPSVAKLLSTDEHILSVFKEVKVEEFEAEEGTSIFVPSMFEENVLRMQWVLRKEDVDLLATVSKGIGPAVGGLVCLLNGLSFAPSIIVTAIIDVFLFLRQISKKNIPLSPVQIEVLRGLKFREKNRNERMTVEDIEAWLLYFGHKRTQEEVYTILKQLSSLPQKDKVVELVKQDSDGRWRAVGV